jgi:uncharacterized protein YciI
MKQYVITGYDYTDEGALERRMAVRPNHLSLNKGFKERGNYVMGGAILDDNGKMIGSVMVMQFETAEELEAWKREEPYINQKIWESVDVRPFRVATVA